MKVSTNRRCWKPIETAILFCFALAGLTPLSWAGSTNQVGTGSFDFSGAVKATSLFSYGPDDPLLSPDRWNAAGLFRFRLGMDINLSNSVTAELAYEHRARLVSGSSTLIGGAILPSEAPAPFRINQLDWSIAQSGDCFSYRHELDRAFLAIHPSWGEVNIGRQAVGLGRGVLFGAIDVFAPFSPLEVDREWRRGIDAARIEYTVSDTSSVEVIGAAGDSWDQSALVGRFRGYIGDLDGELILGKRAQDMMYGGSFSSAVKDAEVHVELALFDTPANGASDAGEWVTKVVSGASYTFDIHWGLTLMGEYHYSGFGVENIENLEAILEDPVYVERLLRGDFQILGQHGLAARVDFPISDSWTSGLMILQSPVDGSGVAAPSIIWDVADSVSMLASGFIPWGADPIKGQLKSEYGATPVSIFLQLNLYY